MATSKAKTDFDADLAEAGALCDALAEHLPTEISAAALGVWSKAPFNALTIREALIWRTEEIARVACGALAKGDRAVGILLTRSVIENTALLWRLYRVLQDRHDLSHDQLRETLLKMLMGWKSDREEKFPVAFNVLTLVDHLDKELPGVRASYDSLSEVAHPNYRGVHGLYAKIDREAFVTRFGRDLRGESAGYAAASALCGSLGLFHHAYNAISDVMLQWLSELSPLSGPRDPD